MEQNINYDRIQDQMLQKLHATGIRPTVLVHSCCAPCSTYVLEKLTKYADVTIFFYNPNIHPKEEYYRRELAQQAFIKAFNKRTGNQVAFYCRTLPPKRILRGDERFSRRKRRNW